MLKLEYLREDGEVLSPSENDDESSSILNQAIDAAIRGCQVFKPHYKLPRVGNRDREFAATIKLLTPITHWAWMPRCRDGRMPRSGQSDAIKKILTHVGIASRPPPLSPSKIQPTEYFNF